MNLYITFENKNQIVEENYSIENDLIEVYDILCSTIDDQNLAKFHVIIDNYNFFSDFAYDFTSIMPGILYVLDFLKNGKTFKNRNTLNFYELRVILRFEIFSDEVLITINDEYSRIKSKEKKLSRNELINSFEKLVIDFHEILYKFFPKAYYLFKGENYMIFENNKFIFDI